MRHFLTGIAVVVVVLGGCGSGEDRPGSGSASVSGSGTGPGLDEGADFEKADADTLVDVTGRDFRFEGIPSTVAGSRVWFAFTNDGPSRHELEILGPDGKGVGEVAAIAAGKSGTLALELEPGTYTAQCILEADDGQTHAELGMKQAFTVT